MPLTLNINGEDRTVDAAPDTPLLWVLRDHLGLTGTKYGCGVAQCGACMVHIDGAPQLACITPAEAVEGRSVTTIEGREGPAAEAVRAAWEAIDAPQCGYCQPGQIMSAIALLEQNPNPSDDDIDAAMRGNLCRCATYMRIRRAIKDAAERL
jgi:isoquinoline 1-oxidoreductase alpha subunit